MARTTLRRWLHFLILRERRRRRRHDDDANNNNIDIAKEKKEAELEYIQSAVSVALLLVQSLLLNSSSSVAQQHIDLDDFTVVIDCGDDVLIITDEEAIENCNNNNNNLQRIIESVTLVEFTPAEHKFSAAQPSGLTQQQNYRQLGIILHEIFCRGATVMPPTCNLDDEEDDDNDDDDDSETKHSIQAAQKMLRITSICALDAHLLNCAVPITLCRLVIDLLIWSDEMKKETKFHSIEEVAEELMQVISKPNLFLYQSDAGGNNNHQLNFGSTLYGRRNEVGRFLRAAALVSLDMRDTHVKQLVLIGGLPGGGKTHFVESLIRPTSIEWFYIHIKFDLLQSQPLSVVISSFDTFFAQILENRNEQEYVTGISASLQRSLSSSAIVSLCDLVPSLRILFPNILRRVVSDEDLSVQTGKNTDDEFASTSQMSRIRVHMLLRRLISAVCSVDRPLVLFFDDLQWADDRSMELLYALMERDHVQELDDNNATHCLFVGSYRSNETNNNLRSYFDIFEHSTSVDVTKIHLGGLARADCNTMISEVLHLPTRLTSPLNDLVLQKTTGNPLYIKTFLHSLVEESVLSYSLPEKRWVWDIEAVKSTSIDKTVLDLLARKLLDLPENVLAALRVLSCLGTKVDDTTIKHLYTSPISRRDFIACLDYAVDEHILEKSQNSYNFLHDMLKQATYKTMSGEDRGKEHLSIGMHVITNASTDTDESNTLTIFIADQINAANAHGVTEDSLHIEFAELNLKAGKTSIDMSDFQSALSYMRAGMSFLDGWKGGKHYNLSLHLFQTTILACYVNTEIEHMQQYLELLFIHAANFEDKLPGYFVMIQAMLSHRKHREATEKILFILEELGEPFSINISPKDVYMDIVSTKKLLVGHTTDDVISGKRMTDAKIRWTLKFLNLLGSPLYIMKPHVVVSIGCRTVALSLEWGVCGDSALGLQIYGWGVLTFQKDVEEALKWCHAGLDLAKRLNAKEVIPRVKVVLDTISYWKEPLQAKFDCLKDNHRELMMVGEFDQLGGNALHFIRRSLVCGRNLLTSEKECAALILELHKLRQELSLQPMISNHLSILKLIGSHGDSEHKLNQPFFHLLKDDEINNDESLLQNALSNQLVGPLQQCYFDRLHNAFWSGNYKEAAEYAEKYEKCISTFRFLDIYKTLYLGLTAFRLSRFDGDKTSNWKAIGKNTLCTYQTWVKYSEWNWENKMLLLEAEFYASEGEVELAKAKFEASVDSAQKHRFINEEGLARELSGRFYEDNGNEEEAAKQYAYARECYKSWGAFALADRLSTQLNL